MIARIGLNLLACTILAAAQPASSKTKPMKEEEGRCQAAVPAEATVILPYMAQGPNKSYSVILDYDSDRYKVQTDAELKEWHYSKAFENSPTRQIVEKESHAVSAGYRGIHVYLPQREVAAMPESVSRQRFRKTPCSVSRRVSR